MKIYNDINAITEKIADSGQLYIYVVENYPQMNIKIGRTTNPKQRMRSLSGSNNGGNKISRVAISPMTYLYTLEECYHTKFNKFRIRGTEYFSGVTFEEVVAFLQETFESDGYKNCNNVRKNLYEQNPKSIPNFLKNEGDEDN